jgi:aminopeptidase
MQSAADRIFPAFSLSRLLGTVFDPIRDLRVALLIDLQDPSEIKDFAYLKNDAYSIQRHAYEDFYRVLHDGVMDELGLKGGEIFAYQITGGSNLDLPDRAVGPSGEAFSLERDVYPHYDLILCVSTYSATAPLTTFAKTYGFRGATLHGVNDIILSSGLCVDYNDVAADAEKLRIGMTRADRFEVDFEFLDRKETLTLHTDRQEAQKSQGLCLGLAPDVANLPAGEIYYVPKSAEGRFPLVYETDGTIGLMEVAGGRIQHATLLQGDPATVDAHNRKIEADPVTGELGELGFGTQVLPVSGADIQDEKILGTMHVATGRSDHLGGDLTPDRFEHAGNATHDDILFAPHKTPQIDVSEVRMYRNGRVDVLIEHFQPAEYMQGLLSATV